MILDTLDKLDLYKDVHPRFAGAITYLQATDLDALPSGKHEVDGENIFVIAATDPAKTKAEGRLETHNNYIDIQIVLAGKDNMGWRPKSQCLTEDTTYDAERDLQFFKDMPETWLGVKAGMFAIFFPEDAHMPLIGEGELKKIVVKVRA